MGKADYIEFSNKLRAIYLVKEDGLIRAHLSVEDKQPDSCFMKNVAFAEAPHEQVKINRFKPSKTSCGEPYIPDESAGDLIELEIGTLRLPIDEMEEYKVATWLCG